MRKICLASHGTLAKGLKSTLEIFLGSNKTIIDVCAYTKPGESHLDEIQKFIDSAESGDVIFTDIYGGSVNQQVTSMVIKSNKKIPIITSMNLPIVLSIALTEEKITPEFIESIYDDCAPKLVEVAQEKNNEQEDDIESFMNN